MKLSLASGAAPVAGASRKVASAPPEPEGGMEPATLPATCVPWPGIPPVASPASSPKKDMEPEGTRRNRRQ
jgi:hypothetical protein